MSSDQTKRTAIHGDPVQWLETHGDVLFGYAIRRVHRHDVAEDLVQDTLLAGFQDFAQFNGRANIQTWLTGILKNKIVDHYRREAAREVQSLGNYDTAQSQARHSMFNKNGQWMDRLVNWSQRPEHNLERDEFWQVFDACISKMPTTLKAIFVLREMDGADTSTVCKQLAITEANASVRLFRARLSLRKCLELNWFQSNGKGE